jgi:acetylornithine deacetylase/succinyl-diaminopimelate desuccinylase-like protein
MAENVVKTLIDLMLIPSTDKDDKGPIIAYVSDFLRRCGVEVKVVGRPDAPAIAATYGFGGVGFSGHLDTVPLGENWTRDQGEVEGRTIYGRGAVDMKGACASMLHAARALVVEDVPFYILLTTDEETVMAGAEALKHTHAAKNASSIIIGEPTEMRVVYKEKGVARFDISTGGRAVHASTPWLGRNAITSMMDVVSRLKRLQDASSEEGMSLSITTIDGGVKNNVVPDECRLEVDVRFPVPMTPHEVEEIVVRELMGLDCEVCMDYGLRAFETDPQLPFIREAVEWLGKPPLALSYATEAAVFSGVNDQVFICGPGPATLAHTADEHIEREQLERAIEFYKFMAREGVQG